LITALVCSLALCVRKSNDHVGDGIVIITIVIILFSSFVAWLAVRFRTIFAIFIFNNSWDLLFGRLGLCL